MKNLLSLHEFLFSDMISTMDKQMGTTCSHHRNGGGGQNFDFFNRLRETI